MLLWVSAACWLGSVRRVCAVRSCPGRGCNGSPAVVERVTCWGRRSEDRGRGQGVLCLWQTVARAMPAPLSRVCARGSRRSVSAPSHFELAFDVMKQTQGGHTLLPPCLPGRIATASARLAACWKGGRVCEPTQKRIWRQKNTMCTSRRWGQEASAGLRHARPEGAQFETRRWRRASCSSCSRACREGRSRPPSGLCGVTPARASGPSPFSLALTRSAAARQALRMSGQMRDG